MTFSAKTWLRAMSFALPLLGILLGSVGMMSTAHAETCTPKITLKGNGTTGPITVGVGKPIVWSYVATCAERIEFFVRTKSTTGNCTMSALSWAGWRASSTQTTQTFPSENVGDCQAGGDWEVAATAIKGNVASTTSVVGVNVPTSQSTVGAGSGTTSTYTLNQKATVRDRANGESTDRLYQHIVSDEPSMVNFFYNTAREGVRDWNEKNGYTYSDPIGLYPLLAARYASSGDVGINTFISRVSAETTESSPTVTLGTTEDWLWQISTNPTKATNPTTCSRTAVIFGTNTNTNRKVTITGQSVTGSSCSASMDPIVMQSMLQARENLKAYGIPVVAPAFDSPSAGVIHHAVPDDAPLPNRREILFGRND